MANFNITDANNLFKIKYGKLSENTYNSANVTLARVKKEFNFTGRQMFVPVPTAFVGGVGSGSLPTANSSGTVEDALITAKKVYGRANIDREAIKASANDEGAFVRATKWVVQKTVESWMRNMSRILYGESNGKLGQIEAGGVVDNGGGNYDITISNTAPQFFKEANWEENDYVNIGTGSTDLFDVISVNPTTRVINVQRISGATVPAPADDVFMQGSENNDPEGLRGVLDATAGAKYSVNIGRRWQATQVDAGGSGLIPDLMNQVMLDVQRKSGKVPNLIMASYTQYRKLLNVLEDQKQYSIGPRAKDLQGAISFKGVEFMSSAGAVGVFPERFIEDDRLYFLNDEYITIHHRPDFGWFDDDGSVFLRTANSDEYEARYGGYLEAYIVPSFHGVITNLAL